jgi:EAL domain-containing protein (putative c-di-GMP-specific phosphodiesterase class I)
LKKLPIDQLKIDRSFVRDILIDPNDAAIAQSVIGLSQTLGLSVLAEGVEYIEQRDKLLEMGCNLYQGYYFSKPLALEEFEWMVKKTNQSFVTSK